MHIQLSSSHHFYLLCLVLNSSDRNNAFWRHSMLVKQFSSLSRKHRILSLQICVYQTVEPKHRIWGLMQRHWSSASLTHHKTSSTKQLVEEESGYAQAWRRKTSLWTSGKLKPTLFRANTLHNRFFSEPPTEENTSFRVLSITAI